MAETTVMQVLPDHWRHALSVANRFARRDGLRYRVRWSGGYWLVEALAQVPDPGRCWCGHGPDGHSSDHVIAAQPADIEGA